jgi:hypothetical protein
MSVHFTKRGSETPFSMPTDSDTHEAWKSKGAGYKTKRVLHNEVTTDAFDVESKVFDMRLLSKALVHVKEVGGTNAIKYNLLGSIDGSIWATLNAVPTVVLAGALGKELVTDAYSWLKLQVASNLAGNAGKVTAFINGKTP